jgi:hypothetical protein
VSGEAIWSADAIHSIMALYTNTEAARVIKYDGREFARLNLLILFSDLPALTSRSTLLINCG